jgi:hypothetical protein
MKTASLFFLSYLILAFLCSIATGKNKLKTKDDCVAVNPNNYTFNDKWTLSNGYGEIQFKGKGRDGYIKLHNQKNDSSHQYWIIISGWDNTKSRVTRGDGSTVCEIPQTLDLNRTYDYTIVVNPSASRIRLLVDGDEAWTCIDKNGWNAPNAKYFSISKWCCANMSFCNVKSNSISEDFDTCWVPNPSSFKYSWSLDDSSGILSFDGYGNDLYIKLSNQQSDSSYQYWIIMSGWNNTTTKVQRGDGSTVCTFNQIVDLTKTISYDMVFDQGNNSIELFANGSKLWTCVDSHGWNAPNAKWIGISRYSGSFYEICGVETTQHHQKPNRKYKLNLSKTVR